MGMIASKMFISLIQISIMPAQIDKAMFAILKNLKIFNSNQYRAKIYHTQ